MYLDFFIMNCLNVSEIHYNCYSYKRVKKESTINKNPETLDTAMAPCAVDTNPPSTSAYFSELECMGETSQPKTQSINTFEIAMAPHRGSSDTNGINVSSTTAYFSELEYLSKASQPKQQSTNTFEIAMAPNRRSSDTDHIDPASVYFSEMNRLKNSASRTNVQAGANVFANHNSLEYVYQTNGKNENSRLPMGRNDSDVRYSVHSTGIKNNR